MPKASMLSRRQWVVLTDFCLHPLPQSPLSLINVKSENTFFQNYYHIHRNKKIRAARVCPSSELESQPFLSLAIIAKKLY
jgi:hypothetical protein